MPAPNDNQSLLSEHPKPFSLPGPLHTQHHLTFMTTLRGGSSEPHSTDKQTQIQRSSVISHDQTGSKQKSQRWSSGVLHCAKMFHPSTNQKQLPFSSRGCILQVLSFTGLYSEENKWNKTRINLMRIIPQLHMPFKSTSNL